jgi:hypothetical protein
LEYAELLVHHPATAAPSRTMSEIPDFTPEELKIVQDTVDERYGEAVELHPADAEVKLGPGNGLTTCPTLFWHARKANYVILKTGDSRYRGQFFYDIHQIYGTGIEEYDDLPTCVSSLLRVQADDELTKNMSA